MKKVQFRIFENFRGLQNTVTVMVTTKYDNFKHSYQVKRLADELQARHDDFKKMHQDIIAEAEWDDGADKTKEFPKNKAYIDAQVDELFDTPFDLKWAPLPVAVIEKINPTPEQFSVLEFLMDPDDVPVQPE